MAKPSKPPGCRSRRCRSRTRRFADERVYLGFSGLERLLDELDRDLDELRFCISDIRAVGKDKVYAATMFIARGKRSKAHVEQPLWFVHTFSEGLIVGVDNYPSRAQALEAAGLEE